MLKTLYSKVSLITDIHEIGMVVITGDISPGNLLTIMFYLFKMTLIGFYFVNPDFWNKVHETQIEYGIYDGDFLTMLPDIKLIIEVL